MNKWLVFEYSVDFSEEKNKMIQEVIPLDEIKEMVFKEDVFLEIETSTGNDHRLKGFNYATVQSAILKLKESGVLSVKLSAYQNDSILVYKSFHDSSFFVPFDEEDVIKKRRLK